MQTKDWFLIFGPLVGVLIGGGITFLIQWFSLSSQRKAEDRKRRIIQLEEHHLLVNQYAHVCSESALKANQMKQGKLPFAELHTQLVDLLNFINGPMHKLNSLQRICTPELSDEWSDVIREELNYTKALPLYFANGISQEEFSAKQPPLQDKIYTFLSKMEEKISKI